MSVARIRKANRIHGKNLIFRNASIADGPFILSLRTDEQKSRHLSIVSNNLAAQEAWLAAYEKRDTEAYFIIENGWGVAIGTVRLYDALGDSFCWGSWILVDDVPSSAAIESALMVYRYAVDALGFRRAHFQVQKGNERVWRFHERFGAERLPEEDIQYRYTLSYDSIQLAFTRYRRYLPESLRIESAEK